MDLVWLEPPASSGEVTVLDMLGAKNPDEHAKLAREWAKSLWEAWADHHATVRRWDAA